MEILLTVLRQRILRAPAISFVQHEQPACAFVAAAEPLSLGAVAVALGCTGLAEDAPHVRDAWRLSTGGGFSLMPMQLELRIQALLHWDRGLTPSFGWATWTMPCAMPLAPSL